MPHPSLAFWVRHFIAKAQLRPILDPGQNVDKMSPYASAPLRYQNSARILLLAPGDDHDIITCKLYAADDIASEEYEALSYVWGSPANPASVICNGCTISVTQNLYKALRGLRQPHSVRHLWIDALCINQSDNEERSHQVRNMARIYHFAEHVIVWLGEGDQTSHEAIEFLSHLWSLIPGRSQYVDFNEFDEHGPRLTPADKESPVAEIRELFTELSMSKWAAMGVFLRNQYFERVWVLQEVAFAAKATFVCGKDQVPMHKVVYAMLWTVYRQTSPFFSVELNRRHGTRVGGFMFAARNNLRHAHIVTKGDEMAPTPFVPLFHVLRHTATSKATDARDKIIAVLGMADDVGPNMSQLVPDYSKNAAEIYTQAAIFFLEKKGNLRYLQMMPDVEGPTNMAFKLPSWVIDWTWHSNNETVRPLAGRDFQAGGSEPAKVSISDDEETCIVNGSLIGQVTVLGLDIRTELVRLRNTYASTGDGDMTVEENKLKAQWFQEMENMAAQVWPDDVERRDNTLWRTLTGDQDPNDPEDGPANPETMHGSFNALRTIFQAYSLRKGRPDDIPAGKEALFYQGLASVASDRRLAIISSRPATIGLVSRRSQVGDSVYVLHGLHVPVTLRPHAELGGCWQFVNECYAHGFMAGEGLEMRSKEPHALRLR
ncbi:heterokaryon incompatibility protein-domain-containing protein [Hypoxylon rubiginosum]|uniref:Heterokaryon incompatibility protein-domain-containing protein n=1 Tax=Hypoxylon rubiginosum TaxID=110542 RepID=A0ACC0DG09_9PEZI|nr:heterokaryon incompatibility protein-domain-containing protein [Hypoxylon rubiginosum]